MENANLKKTEYSVICAVCVATSAAMQPGFSLLGMNCAVYLSALVCAMCCPLEYGVFCGVISPVIAMIEAGSPTPALLPGEIGKCFAFVLCSKLLFAKVKSKTPYDKLYLCLILSVCVGQISGGLISAALLCRGLNSIAVFVMTELVAAIPEIITLFALLTGIVPILKTLGLLDESLFAENQGGQSRNIKTENTNKDSD